VPGVEQPCGDLRLDVEPVGGQSEAARHRRAHDLVAGLHVRDRRPVEQVGQRGERAVGGDRHARRVAPADEKPRAVDDVGVAIEYRLDQPRQLRRIQFQVGVLDRDHVAGGRRQPEPDRMPLAAVLRRVHDAQPIHAVVAIEHVGRPIAGPVVDDDDFAIRWKIDRQQPLDHGADGGGFVEDGNEDRDQHAAIAKVAMIANIADIENSRINLGNAGNLGNLGNSAMSYFAATALSSTRTGTSRVAELPRTSLTNTRTT
jgi:hypothetical protein